MRKTVVQEIIGGNDMLKKGVKSEMWWKRHVKKGGKK
jgi:hypothetical protein